jgi:Retroviral aspartyl protease
LDRSPHNVFIPNLGKSYQFIQQSKAPVRKVSKQLQNLENRYTKKVQELEVKVQIRTLDSKEEFLIKALIDSGCTHSTINSDFIKQYGLTMIKLDAPRVVKNVDRFENITGQVIDLLECIMEVTGKDHQEQIDLAITKLGSHQLFLGYDWIKNHNPSINWQIGEINFDRYPVKFNCKTNANSITPWARAQANISAEIVAAKETFKERRLGKKLYLGIIINIKWFLPRTHSMHYRTNDHGTMPLTLKITRNQYSTARFIPLN